METQRTSSLQHMPDDAPDGFRALTERYIDLVYAAARRQVGDAHLAEDVTQAVFIILAQKMGKLPADRPLGAWLLRTTAYVAANARRRRAQREHHERRAAEMARDQANANASHESQWSELSPLLDEGVNRLGSGEREALVMRYFEKMSLGDVGAAQGITEAAAGKRVSRAIEKLRDFFQRRGVTVSAAVLATVLVAKTTEAAPVALVSAVSAASTGAAAPVAASPLVKGTLIAMASAKTKLAVAAGILLLMTTGVTVVVVESVRHPATPVPTVVAAKADSPFAAWETPRPVRFSDGAVVELLGMHNELDPNGKWWGPDGLEVPPPAYHDNSRFTVNSDEGSVVRLILRLHEPAAQTHSMEVVLGGVNNYASSGASDDREQTLNMLVGLKPGIDTTTVRIGLSSGEWTDTALYDVATSKPAGPDSTPLRVGTITEEDGKALVQIFDLRWSSHRDRDERIVVVANGRMVASTMSRSEGLLSGMTYRFDCPKDQITSVVLRSRPYEWMEMKNVSLHPTTQPTQVSIGPATQPATEPGGK